MVHLSPLLITSSKPSAKKKGVGKGSGERRADQRGGTGGGRGWTVRNLPIVDSAAAIPRGSDGLGWGGRGLVAGTQTPNSKHWFTTSYLQEGAGKRCLSAHRHYALHDCQFLLPKTCKQLQSLVSIYPLLRQVLIKFVIVNKHVSVQHVKDNGGVYV